VKILDDRAPDLVSLIDPCHGEKIRRLKSQKRAKKKSVRLLRPISRSSWQRRMQQIIDSASLPSIVSLPALRRRIKSGQSSTFERWAGLRGHLASIYFRFAAGADEFRFDRVAAGPMDKFHWRSGASSHPAVTPPGHGGHQRIEIKPLVCEAILESTRVLFVLDTAKNTVVHQLAQAVRQAMRRELQILPNRVELADAEKDVADYKHRPAVADH
jgi:hypothetical protein